MSFEDSSNFRTWLVGSGEDCDIVIDHPRVSSHHCRITRDARCLKIEDLNSTNGTWIEGQMVKGVRRLRRGHRVLLGKTVEFIWPAELLDFQSEITIGRDASCDVCLDKPNISMQHAKLVDDGESLWIVDCQSTNGVSLSRPDNLVDRARVTEKDAVYLGSTRISIQRILDVGMGVGHLGPQQLADRMTERILSDTIVSDEEQERRAYRRRALMTALALLSVLIGGAAAVYYATAEPDSTPVTPSQGYRIGE